MHTCQSRQAHERVEIGWMEGWMRLNGVVDEGQNEVGSGREDQAHEGKDQQWCCMPNSEHLLRPDLLSESI